MKLKNYLLLTITFSLFSFANAQDELPSTGSFGEKIDKDGAVPVVQLVQKFDHSDASDMKVQGTIVEVCQAKGCWMTIDLGNNETMRVKFKDYGFFVPKDAAGKTAVMQGVAKKETISVEDLRHLAEDAGKSEAEINAIKESKEELTFVAKGVIIE